MRAAERWIDAEPTAQRVKSQWKEGKVETASEMGKSFVRITTDGKTNPTFAAMSGVAPAVDASKQFVKVLLRVHGFENLAGIEVRVGSDSLKSAWYSYTVPLYGDPLYNLLQDGEWTAITMTLGANNATGAPKRSAIDSFGVAVSDKGKGPVQLDFGGVALVDEPAEGVVSFTFDDGYKEHLTAMKLLAEHGWHGTAYVIPMTIGRSDLLERRRPQRDPAPRQRRRGARRSALHRSAAGRARAAPARHPGTSSSSTASRSARSTSRIRSASRRRVACGRPSTSSSRRRASRARGPRRCRPPIRTCCAP